METEGKRFPAPFVVGAGRSGTTLLRLMLDAHPELAIPPETHFISRAVWRCRLSPFPRRTFLKILTSDPRWTDHHIGAEALRERVNALPRFELGEALRVFYRLYAERFGKPRWGDKTPPYVLCMDTIQTLLPEAHFIHLVRDGRDVALSIRDLWFGPRSGKKSMRELARWWVARIRSARRQAKMLRHYTEIRFEDLVSNPAVALRRICDFIELPWDDAMLDYHRQAPNRIAEMDRGIPRPGGGQVVSKEERRRIHSWTSQPPALERLQRWKVEMPDSDRAEFERVAGATLRELGYEL